LQRSFRSLEPTINGSIAAKRKEFINMSNAPKKNTISYNPKRNRRIEFYVNDAEYSRIEKLQSIIGITKSALMRKLIMDIKIKTRPPEKYYDIYRLMQNLTNNANQLARIANSTGSINAQKIDDLLLMVDKCFDMLESLE